MYPTEEYKNLYRWDLRKYIPAILPATTRRPRCSYMQCMFWPGIWKYKIGLWGLKYCSSKPGLCLSGLQERRRSRAGREWWKNCDCKRVQDVVADEELGSRSCEIDEVGGNDDDGGGIQRKPMANEENRQEDLLYFAMLCLQYGLLLQDHPKPDFDPIYTWVCSILAYRCFTFQKMFQGPVGGSLPIKSGASCFKFVSQQANRWARLAEWPSEHLSGWSP